MSGGRAETWALVVVKRFASAKSRLAPALAPAAREALAEAMFEDVLAALSRSTALDGVLVVTADSAAADVARRFAAMTIHDFDETGVNAAVAQGLDFLARQRVGRAIVVPADVPLLTGSEVDAVAAALDHAGVVLTPADRDGGTNVLALSPVDAVAPAYGPDSLRRHAEAAAAAGVALRIMPLAGAGLDIDVADDLDVLARRGAGTRARALLRELSAPTPRSDRSLPERIMQQ